MDHLCNGESNYRILHDPMRRTVELIDFSNTPEMSDGVIVIRISEKALTELMLQAKKWGVTPGGIDDFWDKLLKAMELMGKIEAGPDKVHTKSWKHLLDTKAEGEKIEKTQDKRGVFGKGTCY